MRKKRARPCWLGPHYQGVKSQQKMGLYQKKLDELAERYGISRSVAALAFTRGFGADVIPIIGTQNPARITEVNYSTLTSPSKSDAAWRSLRPLSSQ